MTDLELIELSAKVAGATKNESPFGVTWTHPPLSDGRLIASSNGWNPLDNDGDAFRLAHATNQILALTSKRPIEQCRRDIVEFAANMAGP